MTSLQQLHELEALAVKSRHDNELILASIGGQEVFADIRNSELMERTHVAIVPAQHSEGSPPVDTRAQVAGSRKTGAGLAPCPLHPMGRVSVLAVDGRSKDAARARSANNGRCSRQANNPVPINRVILDHTGPSRPIHHMGRQRDKAGTHCVGDTLAKKSLAGRDVLRPELDHAGVASGPSHPMERKHGKQTCSMGGNPGRPTVDKNGSARRLAMPKTKVAGGLRVDRIARVAPGPLRPHHTSELMGSPDKGGAEIRDRHMTLAGVHRGDAEPGAGPRSMSGAPRPYSGPLADMHNRLGSAPHCPRSMEPSRAAGASAPAALVGGRKR